MDSVENEDNFLNNKSNVNGVNKSEYKYYNT